MEIGHRRLLDALGARPYFDLDLRLGEGTGAALAMTLLDASLSASRAFAINSHGRVAGVGPGLNTFVWSPALGANAVTRIGAQSSLPDRAAVEAFLRA